MACGGLLLSEQKISQRLHHNSVRVAEFAMSILGFITQLKFKDGSPIKVKIGIHTGKVVSCVMGEFKP